jgi:hypothetical protein
VTVCSALSMLVTVTVAPAGTTSGEPKAKPLMVIAAVELAAELAAAEPLDGVPGALEPMSMLPVADALAVGAGGAGALAEVAVPPPGAHPAAPSRTAASSSVTRAFPVFMAHPLNLAVLDPAVVREVKLPDSILLPLRPNSARPMGGILPECCLAPALWQAG